MKIAVVGGGSTYTPELVDGLLRRQEMLGVDEIALIDPDSMRLTIIGPLAQRMTARRGLTTRITWTDDLADGVSGATYVVSQIRVGGMAARHRDELLGREFGLIGQETVGVGGFANALRTIPVALRIADVIEREAPGATLLNFTNPAGLLTEALCRHGRVPTIGLCNVPWSFKAQIAGAFDTTADAVELDYVGLNHLSWVRRVVIDGDDRTPDMIDGMAALSAKARPPGAEPNWTAESIRLIGALPNPYLLYYYETAAWREYQATHPTRASEVTEIEQALLSTYADEGLDHKPPGLELRGGAYYSEAAAALMADLRTDAGTVHIVNVPNRGAIPGLGNDVVVEVAARITNGGPSPIDTSPLRPDVDALVRTVKDFELLTVQAAVRGDQDAARRALLTNPLGPPAHQVDALLRRLQEVHAGYLGPLEAAAQP